MSIKRIIIGEKVSETVYPRLNDGQGKTKDIHGMTVNDAETLNNVTNEKDFSIRKRMEKSFVLRAAGDWIYEDREVGFFTKPSHEMLSAHAFFVINNGKDNNKRYYAINRFITKKSKTVTDCYEYMNESNDGFIAPGTITNETDENEILRLVKVTRTITFFDDNGDGHTWDNDDRIANHRYAPSLIDGVFHMKKERYENAFSQSTSDATAIQIIEKELNFVAGETKVELHDEPSIILMQNGTFLNVKKLETIDVWKWDKALRLSESFDTIDDIVDLTKTEERAYVITKRNDMVAKLPSDTHANAVIGFIENGNIVKSDAYSNDFMRINKRMKLGNSKPTFTDLNEENSASVGDGTGYVKKDLSDYRSVTVYERPLLIYETDAVDIDNNVGRVTSEIAKADNVFYPDHVDFGFYVANDERYWRVTGNTIVDFQESTGEESHDQMICGSTRITGTKMNEGINNPALFFGSTTTSEESRTKPSMRMTEYMPPEPFGRIKKKDTGYVEYTPQFGNKNDTPDFYTMDMGGTMRVYGDIANMPLSLTDKDVIGTFAETSRTYANKSLCGLECEPDMVGRVLVRDMGYIEYTPVFVDATEESTEQLLCGTIRKHGAYENRNVSFETLLCDQTMNADAITRNIEDIVFDDDGFAGSGMDDGIYASYHGMMRVHESWDTSIVPIFPVREVEPNRAQSLCGTISKRNDGYGNRYVGLNSNLVCLH